MKIELDSREARVIGCLLEKQITTPDQYPLSLNALVSACNQKSNRDPVMELDEGAVQAALDALSKKHLVVERSGFGSRVPKYQHRFCNTEFGTLKLDPQELGIVCELLLRGPQTAGELRTRASRMAPFADVSEVETVLERLTGRADGPFVTKLAREPGRREPRHAHLFSGWPAQSARSGPAAAPGSPQHEAPTTGAATAAAGAAEASGVQAPEVSFPASRHEARLARVEQQVLELRAEVEDLKRRLAG